MADKTKIEWADATISPLYGCSKVSPACANCYAERLAARMSRNPGVSKLYAGTVDEDGHWTGKLNLCEDRMVQALRWKLPRRIFVASQSDLFHENVTEEFLDYVFAYMLASHILTNCAKHTFLLLTKRAERMRDYLSASPSALLERWAYAGDGLITLDNEDVLFSELVDVRTGWNWDLAGGGHEYKAWGYTEKLFPLPNVHIGVTCENQEQANRRIPHLLATPAVLRFVSVEPMLELVDLTHIALPDGVVWNALDRQEASDALLEGDCGNIIDHVICGGESGPNARPMHPDWVRSLRDQCAAAGVPFMFKQWGEWGTTRFDMSTGKPVWDVFHDFTHYCNKAPTRMTKGDKLVCPDGHVPTNGCREGKTFPMAITTRVGKARAGRLLDGIEHNALPGDESRPDTCPECGGRRDLDQCDCAGAQA